MDRANHYEAAFEGYLRSRGLCYVAVDESRRSLWGDSSIKSLDFIVHGPAGARLLSDIKGRRFPGGPPERPRRVWDAWATEDDLIGLARWRELFGFDFTPLLVFGFCLSPEVEVAESTWTFRGRRYLWRAASLEDYRAHMRQRSPRWKTVDLPAASFRRVARPLQVYTESTEPALEGCPF